MSYPHFKEHQAQHEYTQKVVEWLEEAHELQKKEQIAMRQKDSKDPPLVASSANTDQPAWKK